MKCGKCCGPKTRLCPVSFGLALGITSALAVLIWFAWMMHFGVPAEMAAYVGALDWSNAGWSALWALIKGFIFGLVLALIYDLIAKCCGFCCRHKAETCGCSCHAGEMSETKRKDVL